MDKLKWIEYVHKVFANSLKAIHRKCMVFMTEEEVDEHEQDTGDEITDRKR